ncbi:MAG: APC family permease [Thermoplasmata archaeon]
MFKNSSDKKLGFWSIFFISIGATIGSGWIYLLSLLASNGGPSSIYTWLFAGVMILIIAVTYAEIGAELPQKSAFVRYPTFAYGNFLGYLFGASYLIAVAMTPMIEARAIVILLSVYFPGLIISATTLELSVFGTLIAALIILLFFAINYFNISLTLILNNIFTVLKVLLLIILIIILLLFAFHPSNFISYGGFFPNGVSSFISLSSLSTVFFALMGFEAILFFSEEIKDPQKNIPRAIIYSIFSVILIYFVLQIAFIGAINWAAFNINSSFYISHNNYSGLWSALQFSSSGANPLRILFSNSIPAVNVILLFLLILTIIAPFITGLIFNLVSSRALYGMAYENYFPYPFLKVSKKYNTPIISLVTMSLISIILLVLQFSFYKILALFTGFVLLIFLTSGPVLYTLRTKAKKLYRPFKIPFASVIAPLSFIIVTVLLFSVGFTDMRTVIYIMFVIMMLSPLFLKALNKIHYLTNFLIVALFIFYAYISIANMISFYLSYALLVIFMVASYLFAYNMVKGTYKVHLKAGYWIIPYILSIFLLIYMKKYGVLSELYSIILLIIMAIIIFYLSVKSAILSEEITQIISNKKEPKIF